MGASAGSFLNRLQAKVNVGNWLPQEDQEFLDRRREQLNFINLMRMEGLPVSDSEQLLEVKPLNWDQLRHLARGLFSGNAEFNAAYRHLANVYKEEADKAIAQREKEPRKPAYFPAIDYSERNRIPLLDWVFFSAFVDFLISPLSDDQYLAGLKGIKLDPDSLWRLHSTLTTVGSGETKLKVDRQGNLNISFGTTFIGGNLPADEAQIFEDSALDQKHFIHAFMETMRIYREAIHLRAASTSVLPEGPDRTSFEQLLNLSQ